LREYAPGSGVIILVNDEDEVAEEQHSHFKATLIYDSVHKKVLQVRSRKILVHHISFQLLLFLAYGSLRNLQHDGDFGTKSCTDKQVQHPTWLYRTCDSSDYVVLDCGFRIAHMMI
jgi:hypothetical protein